MRLSLLALLFAACDGQEPAVSLGGDPTAGEPEVWSGTHSLEGTAQIAADQAVVIEAGTVVTVAAGARLLVLGSLEARGTADAPVVFDAPDGWVGMEVDGSLVGTYLQITGRGGPIATRDGDVELTDSVLDLQAPGASPDCTSINGGNLRLDHVHILGCHCPIHINRATSATVLDSVFDDAAVPVMLANLGAVFHGNVFLGSGPPMQDVGGSIAADVAGNYWGGGEPVISTSDLSQFTGVDDWLDAPPAGAGPR